MITIKLILQGTALLLVVWQLHQAYYLKKVHKAGGIIGITAFYFLASRISVAAMLQWIAMTL